MKKRIMALLTAAMLMLCVPAMAMTPPRELCAQYLAQELRELAASVYYPQTVAGSMAAELADDLTTYAACTWEQPTLTVYITCDAAALAQMLAPLGLEPTDALGAEAAIAAIRSVISPATDAETAALKAILTAQYSCLDAQIPNGMAVCLRFFADGAPIMYQLTAQDAVVSMAASVAVNAGDLAECATAAQVQTCLDARAPGFFLVSEDVAVMPCQLFTPQGVNRAEKAVSLAQELGRQLADPALPELYGLSEAQQAFLADWAAGDYAAPRMVLQLELDPAVHASVPWGFAGQFAMMEGSAVQRRLLRALPGSFMGAVTTRLCTPPESIAASVVQVRTIFGDLRGADGTGVYLLLYEGGHAMMVVWTAEIGVTTMTASYLPLPGLAACADAEAASIWLSSALAPVLCTPVTLR